MKKTIILLTVLLTISTAVFLGAVKWWDINTKPVSSSSETERFVVVKGSSAERVANELYEQELIRSPLAFKFSIQLKGESASILPGEYDLSPSMSLQQIIDQLKSGPDELWVTIPEGLRREQLPDIFAKALNMDLQETSAFSESFLSASEDLEGFLFPDTYLFPPDVTGEQVVTRLKNTFDNLTGEMSEDIAKSEYSLNEIVTLASIVERETLSAEERPVVAGIFFNRLEMGMPLQADATVQYARDNAVCEDLTKCELWEPVLRGDLEYYESPYNTYTSSGIPPAPIASPGLTSIEAVVYPSESDYFYYLHDSEGKIHYARNIQEHNKNVSEYIDN